MPKLSALTGKFKADGQYNLAEYNLYLNSLVTSVKEIQRAIINVADQFHSTVMQEGKWYDDCAANFAVYWNNVKGVSGDGIDRLNNISTVVEELVRITAVNVCTEMKKSSQTSKSYKKYAKIEKFSAGNVYVCGIEDIKKSKLKNISPIQCREGATLVANEQAINNMIKQVSNSFQTIEDQITLIRKLIQVNLINGQAIKFSGLDASTLKNKVNKVKEHLQVIQEQLYSLLEADGNITTETTKLIKSALTTDFIKETSTKGTSSIENISSWDLIN